MLSRDDMWFKDAVIYQVMVKSFFDSSNDGFGDFVGLTEKLDYIRDLGFTVVRWTWAELDDPPALADKIRRALVRGTHLAS